MAKLLRIETASSCFSAVFSGSAKHCEGVLRVGSRLQGRPVHEGSVVMSYRPIVTAGFVVLAALTSQGHSSLAWAQSTGPVAAYAFNETSGTTASDSSGNGNNGTLTNGPVFVAGKNGNAVSLDGVNDYVNLGNPVSLQINTSLTVSAWINASSFPSDDAAVVSKRGNAIVGYQLDTTIDKGPRTIGFKLANSSGGKMSRYGATALQLNQWYHIAGVYNAATQTVDVYLNAQLNNGVLVGPVTSSQQNSSLSAVIGRKSGNSGFEFAGKIDDLRIYNRALTQAEIQADMNTPVGGTPALDTTAPTVAITAPISAATFTTNTSPLTLGGTAADNVGVTQVVWGNDRGGSGTAIGTTSWSTAGIVLQPGVNVLTVTARDAANNPGTAVLTVTYDPTAPTVAITTPTSAATFTAASSPLTLGGTAADNVSVTQVSWSNDRGGSGTATGTTSWSATGIVLQPGANVLTVTARDAANNPGITTLTVTYTAPDTTPPTAMITTPTSAATFTTSSSPLTLGGTAGDNVGVTQVTWANDRGGSGTANGTTSWSATGIVLQPGANVLTVTARDAANNPGPAVLTVTYDATAPTVSITAPGSGATVSAMTAVTATVSDNIGVAGVQFLLDGFPLGIEQSGPLFSLSWNTGSVPNGAHTLSARARDAAGNTTLAANVSLTVSNAQAPGGPGLLRANPANPRYFTDGTGKAILLTGSHTWDTFQDLGQSASPAAFDFTSYVAFLKAHGHNATILWRKDLPTACNWGAGGTWQAAQFPWPRVGPGTASDGKPTFDLSQFDQSFFDRLRDRVITLQQNGIYAIVQLFDGLSLLNYRCSTDGYPFTSGNNLNGITDGGGTGSMTMTSTNAITDIQDAFVRKVIDTLNDLDDVLWEVSEEAPSNSTWWQNHMMAMIHSYEAGKPVQHPVGYPVLTGSSDTTLYNSDADWVAPQARISPTSSCGSGTPTCKVDINDSDHSYFGIWNDSAQVNRNYIWGNFASGNQVLFMDPYLIYWTTGSRNLCGSPVNGVCSSVDPRWDNVRDNLGYTLGYANRMNLVAMTPQPALSSTGQVLATTLPAGAEYLVYTSSGGAFTVNLSATTQALDVEWLNPSTGEKTAGSTVTGGSPSQSFTPPFAGDAVLYLRQAASILDTQNPTVVITMPTSGATFAANASPVILGGSAADDVGVTQVSWGNDRGGSGTASGTTSWSATGVVLQPGANVVTVTASDAANKAGSATLTITYDPTAPTVAITAPTSAGSFTTTTSLLALGGSAADNIGVGQVSWVNSQGGGGPATATPVGPGAVNWSAGGIVLQPGTNVLTVTARDTADNVGSASLTVTYTGPDTAAPSVAIATPTSGTTYVTSAGPLTLGGTAADNVGVTQVAWTNDRGGNGVATGTTSWLVTGIVLQPGLNVLTVTALDGAGNPGSATLAVTYDPTAPTVAITAPVSGATVSGTTTVTANASDTIGVVGVQFLRDGAALGLEQGGPSFSVPWNTTSIPNGTHTLSARARDAAGNTTLAANVSVTVSNAPPSGLAAAYGFDETSGSTAADASGNGNAGTLLNGAVFAPGKNGNAVSLDGVNDYVNIGNPTSLQITTSMTVSAWINSSSFPGDDAAVVSKRGNSLAGYQLDTTIDKGPRTIGFKLTSASGTQMNRYGATALQLGQWYHMAGVYNASAQTLDVYLNGQLNNGSLVGTVTSSQQNSSLNAVVGRKSGDTGFEFAGRIDDVRIYSRALSQAEIQADMNTAIGGGLPPPPDTTPPSVAITAPAAGSVVFNVVAVSANASDNAALAGVQFFIDGAPLGAEVGVSPYSVSWDTTTVAIGDHVLTARARDLAGNVTTSDAVSVTVTSPTQAEIGQWSGSVNWPLVAIHASLLSTGQVLVWDYETTNPSAQLWNPATGTFTAVPYSAEDLFCAGLASLPDGRILVAGGHIDNYVGITDATIFNPTTRSWAATGRMSFARWYPTLTTLPDGRMLVTSGAINCETCTADTPEVYDPAAGTWTALTNATLTLPLYPHMFVLPDGGVLVTGAYESYEEPVITRVLDLDTQTWTTVDPIPVNGGSAAMYLPGKIVTSGLGTAGGADVTNVPSSVTTYVLDMTQPVPAWRQTPSMAFPRDYHNLTILPDGSVLATGGGETTGATDPTTAVFEAELWAPATETWTTMAAMRVPRLYHSTALLLPDGRVLVAGGGRNAGAGAPTNANDKLSAEIFSPPYLFKGPRPTITAVPTTIQYATDLFVTTPSASAIATVALLRTGSVTHAINQDQRFIPLTFQPATGGLTVQGPADANLAPPGYYLLFIVDANGVPSVARFVRLQ